MSIRTLCQIWRKFARSRLLSNWNRLMPSIWQASCCKASFWVTQESWESQRKSMTFLNWLNWIFKFLLINTLKGRNFGNYFRVWNLLNLLNFKRLYLRVLKGVCTTHQSIGIQGLDMPTLNLRFSRFNSLEDGRKLQLIAEHETY